MVPAVGTSRPDDAAGQGRLARTGLADQAHAFPWPTSRLTPPKRFGRAATPVGEHLAQPDDPQDSVGTGRLRR